MTVNTNFYFDIESKDSNVKIRQKKFKECTYKIDNNQIIEYQGMSSWSPASFIIQNDNLLKINDLKFSIDEYRKHNVNLIYYKINGEKFFSQNNIFEPIELPSNSVLEIRIYFNVIKESPI
jgi:hypothetical protein